MKEFKIETKIMTYALSELPDEDLPLMNAAIKATEHSYAPYSKFHVGAAAKLANRRALITATKILSLFFICNFFFYIESSSDQRSSAEIPMLSKAKSLGAALP